MPWKHWSSERIGFALALLAAAGFSFKAIFVKLAYAVPQAQPVDSVTLLALRMLLALPAFVWVGWRSSQGLHPHLWPRYRPRRARRLGDAAEHLARLRLDGVAPGVHGGLEVHHQG